MDYKNLLNFTNATIVAMNEAMSQMGLDTSLIWTQMAMAFKNGAKNILADIGLAIKGNDIKGITESFAEQIKKAGLCQRVNILEVTSSKIVLDMGECILAPATHVIANTKGENFIPACPMAAILYSKIEEITGKNCTLEKFERKMNQNTSIFTIRVD